jgi:hypothetical protein
MPSRAADRRAESLGAALGRTVNAGCSRVSPRDFPGSAARRSAFGSRMHELVEAMCSGRHRLTVAVNEKP